MMIQLTSSKSPEVKRATQRAIERGKQAGKKLRVRMVHFGVFEVASGDKTYRVQFLRSREKKLARCTCIATVLCVHINVALPFHAQMARSRKETMMLVTDTEIVSALQAQA